MSKKKRSVSIIIFTVCFVLIIAAQFYLLSRRYDKIKQDLPELNTAIWSSGKGTADGRIVLNRDFPEISQAFVNQYETPDHIILFFYHCKDAQSGILSMKLTDAGGNVFQENSVDLMWYNEDVLCFILTPEGYELKKGETYFVDVSVTDIGDDYIEVGATLNPSKPMVFKQFRNQTALFMGLEYTYREQPDKREVILKPLILFCLADILIAVWFFGIIFRKKKVAACITAFLILCILCGYAVAKLKESRQWYNRYAFVSHATGMLNEHQYLNSYDSFEASYEGGHKVFEVDFCMTSDREIVLKHDWETSKGLPQFENGYIPTHEEFMNALIWDRYRTMDVYTLFDLMIQHPDIYIMTDSKEDGYKETVEQFTRIGEILSEYPKSKQRHIRNHMIVQLYNEDMYTAVESTLDAKHYLFTIYKMGGTDKIEDVLRFCNKNDIEVLTMPVQWWNAEINDTIHSYGVKTYLHTLNHAEEIAVYTDKGVDGFYTDVPDLEEMKKEIDELRVYK